MECYIFTVGEIRSRKVNMLHRQWGGRDEDIWLFWSILINLNCNPNQTWSNSIKLHQNGSNLIIIDQNGSNWFKMDQTSKKGIKQTNLTWAPPDSQFGHIWHEGHPTDGLDKFDMSAIWWPVLGKFGLIITWWPVHVILTRAPHGNQCGQICLEHPGGCHQATKQLPWWMQFDATSGVKSWHLGFVLKPEWFQFNSDTSDSSWNRIGLNPVWEENLMSWFFALIFKPVQFQNESETSTCLKPVWFQNKSEESTFSLYKATKKWPDGATCVLLSTCRAPPGDQFWKIWLGNHLWQVKSKFD